MAVWDVIVAGAGPAGIFAAIELIRKSPKLSILILDKGKALDDRACPRHGVVGGCINCKPCSITSGWGGAGAFSDGKLTLTTKFGGFLHEYFNDEELAALIDYTDRLWLEFGATHRVFGTGDGYINALVRRAAKAGLQLIPAVIRHLGTENCPKVLRAMYEYVSEEAEVRTLTAVEQILTKDGVVTGVELSDGSSEKCKTLIVAPGRQGSSWFAQQAKEIGLELKSNPVDIGVRVEVPAVLTDEVTEKVWEPKIHYHSKSFDDLVRTFCVCPHGEVVTENWGDLVTVNGHSWTESTSENTNFALLVSKTFTEPFKEPIRYGRYIASLANLLGGGALVQRLGDLWEGRRSTEKRLAKSMVVPTLKEAVPGDLTLVLPYRYIQNILEMLEALDGLFPGIWAQGTLLYGVEVKFYSSRVEVTPKMQTGVKNLYAIGDGAGLTRSLAQAAVSGVIAARAISS